ncbi:conserved hypothetical protein [Lodderomyces elongisporus NRRL YB-4239]|uniref:Structural maintenance of chromosomes protein n=1 Tax=Lodderomyces elongisporus (strain ATCC 11503 / CBS 2605 / JCM 1781 / NBRC 1676 / NRRL YB-4239) TaxID=379508 RepID=A5E259_LODEL|nr:conserved hypothetical protein [Lodderomyces elongisporus NRRL YB-4239]
MKRKRPQIVDDEDSSSNDTFINNSDYDVKDLHEDVASDVDTSSIDQEQSQEQMEMDEREREEEEEEEEEEKKGDTKSLNLTTDSITKNLENVDENALENEIDDKLQHSQNEESINKVDDDPELTSRDSGHTQGLNSTNKLITDVKQQRPASAELTSSPTPRTTSTLASTSTSTSTPTATSTNTATVENVTSIKENSQPLDDHKEITDEKSQHVPTHAHNQPRLVIEKLVLTNFKSYAGCQTIGPFHSSFSSVVGPNGSGKSNVIDAMLFVFGFKATKMRQGKISELIHNSGEEKPDFCQVDIHFKQVIDDHEKSHKVDAPLDSELIISRKAYQNNQSFYYINDKKSTYTEVTSLLKNQGIDLDHKRFLILQGEVESIAQMKAKAEKEGEDGLLEYLEDIIGTTKYKQLIENSTLEIEELNTACQEKSARFDFVEKDKNLLDEKKAEALRFLEQEKKLSTLKGLKYQSKARVYQGQIAAKEEEVSELSKKLEEKRDSNREVLALIEADTKKQKEVKGEVKTLLAKIDKLNKEKKDLNKQNVSFEEKTKSMETKLKKAQKAKNALTHSLNNAKQSLATYSNSSSQYTIEIDALNVKFAEEEEKLMRMRENLTERTSGFTQEVESLRKQMEPWTTALKENENNSQLLQSNIELLESQMNAKKTQLENSKQRLRQIKTEGKAKEAEYMEKESDLEKIEEQCALGEEQVNMLKSVLEKMKQQITKQRNKLQDSLAIMQARDNKNSVLAALTKLGKSGRIEGFYGRLGDLGTIDEKYDVAISTAAPGLDSMVVETVETAQACIDYLRKNRLGYANFICLDKLSKFDLSPIQVPGDPARIKRLFDLIKPSNSKFAPAFFSKMFNTLVAPNLNEAKAVAYGARRWKVVTLDGKVIDTFGTMSGGGNYVQRGAMKLSSAERAQSREEDVDELDIEQMRSKLREMEEQLEETNREYNESIAALKKVKALEPETRLALDRLKLDIAGLASEMKDVSELRKSLIVEQEEMEINNPFESQILEKKDQLEKLKREKLRLKEEMAESEFRMSELEQKIMEAGGVELKVQNSKVDSIKKQISIINEKTSGDRIAVKKLESDILRHQRLIEQAECEIKEFENALEDLKSSHKEIVSQIHSLEEKIHAVEQEKIDKDEQLEVLRVALEEKEEEISAFKQYEVETNNQLEKINGILRKIVYSMKECEKAFQSIEFRDATPYVYWLDEEEQARYIASDQDKLTDVEIDDIDLDAVESEIEEIEKYMSTIQVDIEILKEYGVKIREYNERREDLNRAVEERDEKRDYCEDLKRKRLDEFMVGFSTISMTLKEMYRMITMGGNAELELVDSLDPFSEGILFSVMPPKKSWRNISNLSGGEKTLSSLALVFALHKYKPTPLYVMDEIDAALDFRNVSIVANYIKERTKNAQFIVISLRNNMFELAQKLIGIFKYENKTKSVPILNIELEDIE